MAGGARAPPATRTRSSLRRRGGLPRRSPASRGDPEARHVIERHDGLVRAHVPSVRNPPLAVIASGVAVLVKGRAGEHHPVLGRDHRVLEGPRAHGRVAVYRYLRLAGEGRGDDVRAQLLAQEPDDLVPAGQPDRLAERGGAVVRGGVAGERVRQIIPELEVDAAEVAVLNLPDLFQGDKVHGTSFPTPSRFGNKLPCLGGPGIPSAIRRVRDVA